MKSNFGVSGEKSNMLHMSKEAFGIFRKNIVKNIGLQNSKDFFFHFGWELGSYDALSVLKQPISMKEKIRLGPLYHIKNGHISGYQSLKSEIVLDNNETLEHINTNGLWIDSFEAKTHIELFGQSDHCICFMLTGYASGYLSKVCNKEVIVKELKCIGKGDDCCEFITKSIEQWDYEELMMIGYFNQRPIVEELSATYDELYIQKELVKNVVEFQTKLMEKIINNNYLESILELTYTTLNLPIIVEDANNQTINYFGLTEENYQILKNDFMHYISENGNYLNNLSKMTHIQTKIQNRLIAPLIIEDLTLGYCSFIFEESDRKDIFKYQLFFDSIINTTLLFLLNQKSKFESADRMKTSFFDDILDRRYSTEDIISRGIYINVNFEKPYYIVALNFNETQSTSVSLRDEHKFISEIHDKIHSLSKDLNFKYLVTNRENNFILYLQKDEHFQFNEVVHSIFDTLIKNKKVTHLKIGVSNIGSHLDNIARHFSESTTALKLAIKEDISYFSDLGLIGIFINQSDKNTIVMYAKEELGTLFTEKNQKNFELLKTAYYFLLSGGNYKETMSDLSISLTGLRYRISKLEQTLNKNLRNPSDAYHILLLLKALIILNELDFG